MFKNKDTIKTNVTKNKFFITLENSFIRKSYYTIVFEITQLIENKTYKENKH